MKTVDACLHLPALTMLCIGLVCPLAHAAPRPDGPDPQPGPTLATPAPVAGAAPVDGAAPAPQPQWMPMPDPQAEATMWPGGKLASLTCGGQPVRVARCRYGSFTGVLSTHHEGGAVAEVLTFQSGLLDGLVEIYDPTGHLQDRLLYRNGLPVPIDTLTPGPVAPPDATLPTLVPPADTAPAPAPEGPPVQAPAPNAIPTHTEPHALPTRRPVCRLGLGLRGAIGLLASRAAVPAYGGAQLVVASQFGPLRPELAIGIYGAADDDLQYRRRDIPISIGQLWNLTGSEVPVYLALQFDATYASRALPGYVPGPSTEEAWLLGGGGGIGIDLPASDSTRLLADLRLGATTRVAGSPPLRIPQPNGDPAEAIGTQFRMLLSLTLLWNVVDVSR